MLRVKTVIMKRKHTTSEGEKKTYIKQTSKDFLVHKKNIRKTTAMDHMGQNTFLLGIA